MNLSSIDTNYLNLHINKIYKYDTSGLEFKFILSYVKIKDFKGFLNKYKQHIQKHNYPYALCYFDENINNEFDYAEIKIALTSHRRQGKLVGLHHICEKIPN